MLFSEPKIPQSNLRRCTLDKRRSFSALQRAENSSIDLLYILSLRSEVFQCSSASRKFLNYIDPKQMSEPTSRFSALQRAENSSIFEYDAALSERLRFQCSSASRKFLNFRPRDAGFRGRVCFSALQRAENSSMLRALRSTRRNVGFSALQRAENSSMSPRKSTVGSG